MFRYINLQDSRKEISIPRIPYAILKSLIKTVTLIVKTSFK